MSDEIERGFVGIGAMDSKYEVNLGTLIRSAGVFGADYVFTIGRRYSDGTPAACGHDRHLPVFNASSIDEVRPSNADVIAIEITENATPLPQFRYPERAVYLLGPEDGDIPDDIVAEASVVSIPTRYCLNVATAGSIVFYDRVASGGGGPSGE